jgi:hypothetical protein
VFWDQPAKDSHSHSAGTLLLPELGERVQSSVGAFRNRPMNMGAAPHRLTPRAAETGTCVLASRARAQHESPNHGWYLFTFLDVWRTIFCVPSHRRDPRAVLA